MSDDAVVRARQSWRAAEARLYPLAMTNVDGYQRALVLVAATCEQLREVTTTAADLLACQARAVEQVAEACDATGTSAQGLDPDDIFGSAAAARDRELAGEERRLARLAAIGRARAAGAGWTDVHAESLGPRVPELRVHVGSGWAILTEVGGDQATGAPALLVTAVRVDLTTGELRTDPGAAVHTAGTAAEWERVAEELQADVS
ncbi:MAG TPA: hypothetical protein VFM27_19965 [Acidimicrobiales bacterium]|nr:hypothetical protein [Acidimicrobiales bacterium]